MKKITYFDFFVLIITLTIIFIGLVPKKIEEVGRPIMVTVRFNNNVDLVNKEAKRGEDIFLNSIDEESTIVNVAKNQDSIEVTIGGVGEISENGYIFENSKILVGQKAELHGKFWAQGVITEVRYAN